jgi:YidC/Oxa1 family membrane protein insertase
MQLMSGAQQLLAVTFQAGPVDWGNPVGAIFGLFERGLGSALAFIFGIVGNYGLSIIILTIILRLLLFPIYARSTKSMRKMQLLQPEIKKMQERHKGDRQKMAEEQMALFKVNQVSPVSGCLPLLAQAPIFMAMYRVINSAQGSKFPAGSIKPSFIPMDSKLYTSLKAVTLTNPGVASFLGMHLGMTPLQAFRSIDETGILPVIPQFLLVAAIVFTGWFQQKQIQRNNEAKGTQQDVPQVMQTMTKVFPIMFGLISLSLPAGVNIYFLTTNTFQIVQQYFMLRRKDNFEIIIPDAETKARIAARTPAGRAAAAAERRDAAAGTRTATKSAGKTAGKSAGKTAAKASANGPVKKKRAPKPVAGSTRANGKGATPATANGSGGSVSKSSRKPVQKPKGGQQSRSSKQGSKKKS